MVTQPGTPEAGLVAGRPFRYEVSDHELPRVRWTFNDLDEMTGWLRGLLLMRHAGYFVKREGEMLPPDTGLAACGWSDADGDCRLEGAHGHDESGALVHATDPDSPGYMLPQRDPETLRKAAQALVYRTAEAVNRGDHEGAADLSRKLTGTLSHLALLERIGG